MQAERCETGSFAALNKPFYHEFVMWLEFRVDFAHFHLVAVILGDFYFRFEKFLILHSKAGGATREMSGAAL